MARRAVEVVRLQTKGETVVVMESDGRDLFVVVDGLRIAKRGHPDTPEAQTWVSLEPGWTVIDSDNNKQLEISYNGVTVHCT